MAIVMRELVVCGVRHRCKYHCHQSWMVLMAALLTIVPMLSLQQLLPLLLWSPPLLLWLLLALLLHWACHYATVPLVSDVGASFVVVLLPMSTECMTK